MTGLNRFDLQTLRNYKEVKKDFKMEGRFQGVRVLSTRH